MMNRSTMNPILPGFYPDPSICRVGDAFYLVVSSFGYFPGLPIFRSTDLVNWTQIGHVLTRDSQLPLKGADISRGGLYAPTIRHHDNRFYVINTNVTHGGNFIVTAEDPAGPWSEPIWIDESENAGIDPSLFFDDDGQVYFTGTNSQGIRQFRIDPDTGKRLSEITLAWPGTGGQYPEAPHLFKRHDYYYLTLAEGGTEYGHMQTIARSRHIEGPWEPCPHNPILTHRSRRSDFHAVGHGDFVEDPNGRWWIVFHAIRPHDYPPFHVLGRETCLASVDWVDDWPVINHGELITADLPDTGLPAAPAPELSSRDNFVGDRLDPRWCHLRNPIRENYLLTGRLGLICSADDLNGDGQPTFIGRRQTHKSCVAAARFNFSDLGEGDEAGLTIFQNEAHHYEVGVRKSGDHFCVFVRRRIGDVEAEVARREVSSSALTLCIEANPDSYAFFVEEAGALRQALASGSARYLGTETAGGFTGCLFGLYATGVNGSRVWVDWFDLSPMSVSGSD